MLSTNKQQVCKMCVYYYYIYSITLYISYEVPVQLTTPTIDPYHISHHEVCTVIAT